MNFECKNWSWPCLSLGLHNGTKSFLNSQSNFATLNLSMRVRKKKNNFYYCSVFKCIDFWTGPHIFRLDQNFFWSKSVFIIQRWFFFIKIQMRLHKEFDPIIWGLLVRVQHKMLLKNYPFCRFSYLASFWNSLEDHSYVWKGHKIFHYYFAVFLCFESWLFCGNTCI